MDKRTALFLFGCMGTRIGFAWAAKMNPGLLWPVAAVVSFGFLYIWVNGLRKMGPETFGEPIWWNDLRPIHGLLWGAFAASDYAAWPEAWKILALDVSIGFGAWLNHRAKTHSSVPQENDSTSQDPS